MSKKVVVIATLLIALLIVGSLFMFSSGKPIGTNLSIVGQGKPTIVLGYENYSPMGGAALSLLRKVRGNYDSRMEFVIADLGTPQGQQFADRHQLFDGRAVFLNQDGEPVRITSIPAQEDELKSLLDAMLSEVE